MYDNGREEMADKYLAFALVIARSEVSSVSLTLLLRTSIVQVATI